MGRTKGAFATSVYKYKLIRDNETTYYTTQTHMLRENPSFNKSFIFKMVKCPETLSYTRDVTIIKLDTPIPIHLKVKNVKMLEEGRVPTLEPV